MLIGRSSVPPRQHCFANPYVQGEVLNMLWNVKLGGLGGGGGGGDGGVGKDWGKRLVFTFCSAWQQECLEFIFKKGFPNLYPCLTAQPGLAWQLV